MSNKLSPYLAASFPAVARVVFGAVKLVGGVDLHWGLAEYLEHHLPEPDIRGITNPVPHIQPC